MNSPSAARAPVPGDTTATLLPLEEVPAAMPCGGKALGLSRLLRAGIAVPAGFVITDAARRVFLAASGLDNFIAATLHEMQQDDLRSLEAASAAIRARVLCAQWPQPLWRQMLARARMLASGARVVVRSSAVGEDSRIASFAGQLDSLLHVEVESGLDVAIKHCWASRWSARALAYERSRGHSLTGMGVIVQRQIDAAYAGVLFTVSPEAGHSDEMLCEFCAGLGNRLVAGEVTPGRVRISRGNRRLNWDSDRPDDAPSHRAIAQLAYVAERAEQLFGAAQDIEWAIARDGTVWLLQARPITAKPAAAARWITWSNANVNENFPSPVAPLLYSIAAPGYTHYFGNLARAFGLSRRRLERMGPDLATIIGVHGGRIYYNLTSIHAVLRNVPLGERLARWFDDFVGAVGPISAGDTPARTRSRSGDVLELAWIAAKTTWQYLFLRRRVTAFERRIDAYAARTDPATLPARTALQLRDELRAFLEIRCKRWTGAALADAAAMVCYGAFKALVARAYPSVDDGQLHHTLLKGIGGLASAEPVTALWNLSRRIRNDAVLRALFADHSPAEIAARLPQDGAFAGFNKALEEYLACWGFRFSGELMLTLPSFQECPERLLAILARYAEQTEESSPLDRLAAQRAERLAAAAAMFRTLARRRLLRFLPWPTQATVARPLLAATQAAIGFRERARLKQALLYSRLRRVALEIGARLARAAQLDAPEDVFMLSLGELDELMSGTAMFPHAVREQIAVRKRAHAEFAHLDLPDVLIAPEGTYPAPDGGADAAAGPDRTARELAGTAVCGGIATGRARVLADVSEACELQSGEILVTRQTDPGWAPVFVAIRGLVLERGGMLSHGAILAREYGIPTLVGVAGATRAIPDRATVKLDANHGVVAIVH